MRIQSFPSDSASQPGPTVSVIMTVHNGEPYLQASLDSILSQSLPSFELVVIDDGSTDGTWPLLSASRQRDPRVVLDRLATKEGTARGLNRALGLARGEFIARQDADDVSHPDRLRRQLEFLQRHPTIGLVSCRPQFIDHAGQPLPTDPSRFPLDDEEIRRRLPDYNCLCIGVLVRRRALDEVGPFRQDLVPSEDYDMWLRLSEVTGMASLPEALYDYRHHEHSASTVRRAWQMWNKARALEDALDRRKLAPAPAEVRAFLARDYVRAAYLSAAEGLDALARQAIDQAAQWEPRLFDEGDLVEQVVLRYLARYRPPNAPSLLRHLFQDLLPRTAHMGELERRLLSGQHLQRVLQADEAGGQVLADLWEGLRRDPSRILRPELWSAAVRGVLRLPKDKAA